MKPLVLGIAALCLLASGAGCGDSFSPTTDPQVISIPPLPPAPPGEEVAYTYNQNVTPGKTTYQGEGKSYERRVTAWRAVTPFGVSPGEVIGTQKPASITEGGSPGVNITPEAVVAAPQVQGSTWTGGAGGVGWLSLLWSHIKDWGLGIGIVALVVVVGGAALYFLVPAAQPIITAILRAIASLFPIFGSLVQRAAVMAPLAQTVEAGQAFKDAVDALPDLTAEQKAKIRQLFNDEMEKKQSDEAVALVKTIKAGL